MRVSLKMIASTIGNEIVAIFIYFKSVIKLKCDAQFSFLSTLSLPIPPHSIFHRLLHKVYHTWMGTSIQVICKIKINIDFINDICHSWRAKVKFLLTSNEVFYILLFLFLFLSFFIWNSKYCKNLPTNWNC